MLGIVVASARARAQAPGIKTPEASPAASVTQTVGLTEMKIIYHRPGVNGRQIWGGLVPYGDVWRAGANENSTISFSTAVKAGGKPLAAGTYGLHMIPTAKEWTIIFSKMTVAWGSFSYDQKEDALRIKVTPQPAETPSERLSYSFDDPTESQVTVALRWEKLKVPIKIEVDTPAIVMANIRDQLRGLPRFGWLGWNQAAQYWLQHGGNMDEAVRMSDRSIQIAENFQNLTTRAAILDKKGNSKGAAELRAKAMGLATENDLNQFGYGLLAQKKVDEAIAIFQKNVQAHPASWNVYDSLGEAYLAKGDTQAASDNYSKALSLVKDTPNRKRIEQTLVRLKGK